MLFPILIHSWALWRPLDECTGLLLCCSRWSLACVQTSPLPQKKNREKRRLWIADDNRVPVSPECWGQPLIGCNANAMTEIISGVSIGEWNSIDSPGKNSAFVDSLPHLYLSGLLIFRGKKSKILRDFQGQIRGKIDWFRRKKVKIRKKVGRFRGILAEKSQFSKDFQGQILRKIGRFHGKFRGESSPRNNQ